MFLLDTNVLSELRRGKNASPTVVAWADSTIPAQLFISAITVLELETGALMLERKDKKQANIIRGWIENRVLPAFAERILPIDTAVARVCAKLHVPNPRSYRDSMIAATAVAHRLTVVTRNARDFSAMISDVLDPWDQKG